MFIRGFAAWPHAATPGIGGCKTTPGDGGETIRDRGMQLCLSDAVCLSNCRFLSVSCCLSLSSLHPIWPTLSRALHFAVHLVSLLLLSPCVSVDLLLGLGLWIVPFFLSLSLSPLSVCLCLSVSCPIQAVSASCKVFSLSVCLCLSLSLSVSICPFAVSPSVCLSLVSLLLVALGLFSWCLLSRFVRRRVGSASPQSPGSLLSAAVRIQRQTHLSLYILYILYILYSIYIIYIFFRYRYMRICLDMRSSRLSAL